MNLKEYFSRIHFVGSYDTADLTTLNQIHEQHVKHIPFENLSIHSGEKIVTNIEACFNKLIKKKRGGWCSENNSVLAWVLKKLGYDITLLGACVYDTRQKAYPTMKTHIIIKVVIDGNTYIADVGFGFSKQIRQPLAMISGKDQPQIPGIFRLTEENGFWCVDKISRKNHPEQSYHDPSLLEKSNVVKMYGFTLEPFSIEKFDSCLSYLQESPESLFTNKSICSLQTTDGLRTLVGWTYGEITYKYKEDMDLVIFKTLTNEEVENTLKEKFGITLENKLVPVNNAIYFTV
ncbi:arylamine N-acetyltransferase, pineal gland isozyme NAT-10-like [Protopterus annectens]|uniref:arylamine N-acetyltransferase, pineal gland isozyme NAT-10-like n=1 Tax=Protopterus annectens TaxID=7888 RepID=UPI001CFC3849|nr:arylamine N-acetyltransferase, pineal gland isozyme NAT-10-like [Protopterus annectens]XP_043937181.1 arylamine N-acetyltransferase, pineal gland isozyme NAT-10-like [Protopterus annectens]XP_043937182.1 arylamine N-acetyltransferase, pineal gland isozyme NAT-10-like [Protopterus annectens]